MYLAQLSVAFKVGEVAADRRRRGAGEAPVSSTSVSTEVGEVPRELMIIFWRNNLIMHASGVAHIWQRIWAVLSTKGLGHHRKRVPPVSRAGRR